jgi:hypothetical protein
MALLARYCHCHCAIGIIPQKLTFRRPAVRKAKSTLDSLFLAGASSAHTASSSARCDLRPLKKNRIHFLHGAGKYKNREIHVPARCELELELELIQTRMIQKQLLWLEVGKSACVLVGIYELRLSPPARYDPQCPSLLDFLSGCLVRVLWTCRSSTDPAQDVKQVTTYHGVSSF